MAIPVTNYSGFNTIQTNSLWQDVKSYGAVGDGTKHGHGRNPIRHQRLSGRGFVWLHNGTFLSGMISLKSSMTLFIDPTATLLARTGSGRFQIIHPNAAGEQQPDIQLSKGAGLRGKLHQCSPSPGAEHQWQWTYAFYLGVEATRPIAIWLVACNQANLLNLNIVDASMWTVVPMQTDFLTISNLSINDDGLNGNRDGIDPVDCWHVTIANLHHQFWR